MPDSLNVPFRQFNSREYACEHAELAGYTVFRTPGPEEARWVRWFAFAGQDAYELNVFDDGRADWRPLDLVSQPAIGGWLRRPR